MRKRLKGLFSLYLAVAVFIMPVMNGAWLEAEALSYPSEQVCSFYIGTGGIQEGTQISGSDITQVTVQADVELGHQSAMTTLLNIPENNIFIGWDIWNVSQSGTDYLIGTRDYRYYDNENIFSERLAECATGHIFVPVYERAKVDVYTDSIPLCAGDYLSHFTTLPITFNTPLDEHTDIMDTVNQAKPAGHILDGWNLWKSQGCGGVHSPEVLAKNSALTAEDYDTIDHSLYGVNVLEPRWLLKYKIDPQPTNETLTVGVKELVGTAWNDITDSNTVAYQWYEYDETSYAVINGTAGAGQISTISEHAGTYSDTEGTWSGAAHIDIEFSVNAGDIIEVEPVADASVDKTADVREYFSGLEFTLSNGVYSQTVTETGNFNLVILYFEDGVTFKVKVIRPVIGSAASGQTTKTLTSGNDGQKYICKATVDGYTMSSDFVTYNQLAMRTVYFNANGGSGTMTEAHVANGTDYTLPTCTFTAPSGKTFGGWALSATGSVITTGIVNVNTDITLYAIWNNAGGTSLGGGSSYITVRFETNGGTEIENYKLGRFAKLTEPDEPEKEGYIFDGWYTDKDLEKLYDFSRSVTRDFTLYAKWVEDTNINNEETDTNKENQNDIQDTDGHNCASRKFNDLDITKWYHHHTDYVIDNGIFNGVSYNTFEPNTAMTRAMMVTVLYRLEGEPATNRSIPFADVDMSAYYANAVIWAQQNGIVNGVSETLFAPDTEITREQIATIMYRYAKYKKYDVSVGESTNIISYDDFDDISEYAIGAMQWAVGSGLINGRTEKTLNPKDNATRVEISAILHRFKTGAN